MGNNRLNIWWKKSVRLKSSDRNIVWVSLEESQVEVMVEVEVVVM